MVELVTLVGNDKLKDFLSVLNKFTHILAFGPLFHAGLSYL